MNSPIPNCRLCFPNGDQPLCRTFDTTIGAMRAFGTLFDDNKMPMMCQGSDRKYRVCSQTVSVVTMHPRAGRSLMAAAT